MAAEAELGRAHPAEEIPPPPSAPAPPRPPGESHADPGSLPRLPGKVRSQGTAKGQPFGLAKGQPCGDVQAPPHAGSWPAPCVFAWLTCPPSDNSFLIL